MRTMRAPMRHALLGSLLLLSLAGCGGGDEVLDAAAPDADTFQRLVEADPPLSPSPDALASSLTCTPFTHPDKPAVLLVHGTFTSGFEQYEWTYLPLLQNRGYDVCYVTYPDRGFGDSQISGEYVVHAIRETFRRSGRRIAVVGHSQGVTVVRWALRWFPSTRVAVDDFIAQAGPNQGTANTSVFSTIASLGLIGIPESFHQFNPDSRFIEASNRGDQTPGDVSYTALYTLFDELVQPVQPVPTAALDFGLDNPRVSNILLQDVCPGRIVDHVTIGLNDALTFTLALDAFDHPGPASVERVLAAAGGQTGLCGPLSLLPDLVIPPLPQLLRGIVTIVLKEPSTGLPTLHLSRTEPELQPYAQP